MKVYFVPPLFNVTFTRFTLGRYDVILGRKTLLFRIYRKLKKRVSIKNKIRLVKIFAR